MLKERISLTINSDLLRKIDQMVDGVTIRNRSHAIEFILSKYFNFKMLKTAVILAGGKGTRLRPITYEIPKPLVPVHDKPIVAHLFDLFKKYGITDIVMCIGYMKEKIKNELGDGSKFGVKIRYVEENEPLGTGGPLRLAKNILKSTFVVSNGDELKDINIMEMYDMHKSNNALVTIALTTVEDPSAYGVARLDGNRIVEFVEKPPKDKAPSKLINAGFYIMEPEVLDMIPEGMVSLEREIFPKIAEMGKLYGYPFSGQWFDTGNIERYERAIKEWKDITLD